MTLKRTIHRRAARKRAKQRTVGRPYSYICLDWIAREALEELKKRLELSKLFSREYDRTS
jgi:hypothetical protein